MSGIAHMAYRVAFFALAPALAASFAGAVHPAGDSLAAFRFYLAGALALSALPVWRAGNRLTAFAGLAAGALATVPLVVTGPVANAGGAAGFALYQKNLLYSLTDRAALVADIRRSAPDFVTLQELSRRNRAILTELLADYPYQQVCPRPGGGATAVLSRWPLAAPSPACIAAGGLAVIRARTDRGPLWVVSLHLRWPWPEDQPAQVDRLIPALAALDGQVVIGGDFNMVPWSYTMRRFEAATATRRAGPLMTTLPYWGGALQLSIDHVLVPGAASGSAEKRPLFGSDHNGVLGRFALPSQPAPISAGSNG